LKYLYSPDFQDTNPSKSISTNFTPARQRIFDGNYHEKIILNLIYFRANFILANWFVIHWHSFDILPGQ